MLEAFTSLCFDLHINSQLSHSLFHTFMYANTVFYNNYYENRNHFQGKEGMHLTQAWQLGLWWQARTEGGGRLLAHLSASGAQCTGCIRTGGSALCGFPPMKCVQSPWLVATRQALPISPLAYACEYVCSRKPTCLCPCNRMDWQRWLCIHAPSQAFRPS